MATDVNRKSLTAVQHALINEVTNFALNPLVASIKVAGTDVDRVVRARLELESVISNALSAPEALNHLETIAAMRAKSRVNDGASQTPEMLR